MAESDDSQRRMLTEPSLDEMMLFVRETLKEKDKAFKTHVKKAGQRQFLRTKFATVPPRGPQHIKNTRNKQANFSCEYVIPISHRTSPGRVKPEHFPNQDAFAVMIDEGKKMLCVILCDGHGKNGHYVSSLSSVIMCDLIMDFSNAFENPVTDEQWKKIFQHAEDETNKVGNLASGTTCTICLIGPDGMQVATVGDSNGYIQRSQCKLKPEDADYYEDLYQFTTEDKPDRPEERARIEASPQGKVFKPPQDPNFRVMPLGLAVSRAIGDTFGLTMGVICEPRVSRVEFTDNDEYIYIGTDGVWDEYNPSKIREILQRLGFNSDTFHHVVKEAQEAYCSGTFGYCDDATLIAIDMKAFREACKNVE